MVAVVVALLVMVTSSNELALSLPPMLLVHLQQRWGHLGECGSWKLSILLKLSAMQRSARMAEYGITIVQFLDTRFKMNSSTISYPTLSTYVRHDTSLVGTIYGVEGRLNC